MKKKGDYTKLRGGYYTPREVSDFLVSWTMPTAGERVLEPSCGDGSFLRALKEYADTNQITDLDVTSIELDSQEAEKSSQYYDVAVSDFFTYYDDNINGKKQFDVLLGNPPFIRYQSMKEDYRSIAFKLMNEKGFRPNRLTNIWVPFLILASEALSDRGRIGMVIPAELFQVNYASEARRYLPERFERLTLVMMNEMIFDGAQQEIVLILGEVKSDNPGVYTVTADGMGSIESARHTAVIPAEYKRDVLDDEKWTRYYLSNEEIALVRRVESSKGVQPAERILDANVGIVTGENKFFIIDDETRGRYGIENCRDIVCGTDFLQGLYYTESEMETNRRTKRSVLFSPPDVPIEELIPGEREYVEFGQSQDYDKGYKCRIRSPWYVPPKSWEPEAFFYRQVGAYPRIVINECGALVTDTLHKVRFKTDFDKGKIAAAIYNSYTLSQCELLGRSYGGGVLTFEPSEVRMIPFPTANIDRIDPRYADVLIRENRIDELIDINDRILLMDGIGLSEDEIQMLNGIWATLRNRRLSRKKGRKNA